MMPFAVSDLLSSSSKKFEMHSSIELQENIKMFFVLKYEKYIAFGFYICHGPCNDKLLIL